MKLYGYFRSSAAYRVRIALNLKGIRHEHVPVHLVRDGGAHKTAFYGALNPQRLVPTLELDDGTLITQSLAIMEFLDARFSGPRLVPEDPLLAARVRAACCAIACEVHPLNNLRVMSYLKNELGLSHDDVTAWYGHWVRNGGLDGVEALVEPGPFCFGEAPTMADCCLIPQLFNARRFNVSLEGLDRLVEIEAHCAALSAFQEAHPSLQPDAE